MMVQMLLLMYGIVAFVVSLLRCMSDYPDNPDVIKAIFYGILWPLFAIKYGAIGFYYGLSETLKDLWND